MLFSPLRIFFVSFDYFIWLIFCCFCCCCISIIKMKSLKEKKEYLLRKNLFIAKRHWNQIDLLFKQSKKIRDSDSRKSEKKRLTIIEGFFFAYIQWATLKNELKDPRRMFQSYFDLPDQHHQRKTIGQKRLDTWFNNIFALIVTSN